MHTAGVDEQVGDTGVPRWFVQSECLGCGLRVGVDAPPSEALALVDRLIWTDDARHVLERMPPYLQQLVRREVEDYARARGEQVITFDLQLQARQGEHVIWDPDAEQRLANVPAPVRAMARMELERTAVEAGQGRVTVGLMEQVKARYFGMGGRRDGP
jgi:hypothetical protein